MKVCSETDCDRSVLARGLCSRHYDRARRAGLLTPLTDRSTWHQLTDVDKVARTGVCSICGPVRIRVKSGPRGAECIAKRRQHRGKGGRSNSAQRHGLGRSGYAELLAQQGGVCAICGAPPATGRSLHIDHDHAHCPGTKGCRDCVRGLLCNHCNVMLGWARDNASILALAAEYLAR